MRFKQNQINIIRQVVKEQLGNEAQVSLFGSRVDDNAKGGDIDLYIIPTSQHQLAKKKIDFLVRLKQAIGEQKIDVVTNYGEERPIDRVAKAQGVLLWTG